MASADVHFIARSSASDIDDQHVDDRLLAGPFGCDAPHAKTDRLTQRVAVAHLARRGLLRRLVQLLEKGLAVILDRHAAIADFAVLEAPVAQDDGDRHLARSEEHTSELQSLMRISYAVLCLKKQNIQQLRQVKKNNDTKEP